MAPLLGALDENEKSANTKQAHSEFQKASVVYGSFRISAFAYDFMLDKLVIERC